MNGLGRRLPPDFDHVLKFPVRALISDQLLVVPPAGTEKSLGLPWWWKQYDQGEEGACAGFGHSSMMSITNHYQRRRETGQDVTFRYAARWLYLEAQFIDGWDDTPPEEGTTSRAACEILRARGHRRVQRGVTGPESLDNGISAYRWATTIDEIRAAIYSGRAVTIGINWYDSFDGAWIIDGERWLPQGNLGSIRGGHCVCLYRMSDRRQAFMLMNSWGAHYPPTWMPYATLKRLLSEDGEAVVITDR